MVNRPLPTPSPSVNQVTSLFLGPCAVPAYALVGLAVFDAIESWWSIFSPNWKDTIKEGPGRKSWLHQLEVTLDEADEVQPTWFMDYKGTAYFLFEFFDIFSFWFMVGYEVVKGFLDWTSTIWKMSPCTPQPNKYYVHSKSPDGTWFGSEGGFQLGPLWFNLQTNLAASEWSPRFTIPAGASCNLMIAVQYTNSVTGDHIPMNVRVTDGAGGEYFVSNFNAERKHDAKLTSGMVELGFTTGERERTYQIEVEDAGGLDLICGTIGGHFSLEYETF